MKAIRIKLDSMEKVKGFVKIASRYAGEFEVSEGKYTANGKSMLGILSLDLKNDLTLKVRQENDLHETLDELRPYIIVNEKRKGERK